MADSGAKEVTMISRTLFSALKKLSASDPTTSKTNDTKPVITKLITKGNK
jgi:hypothetical protein